MGYRSSISGSPTVTNEWLKILIQHTEISADKNKEQLDKINNNLIELNLTMKKILFLLNGVDDE